MPKTAIPFIIILLSAAFIHPANAQGIQPGLRKVIMYNRATKEIKPACMEIVGKYDVIPSYECYDEKDKKSIPFDPILATSVPAGLFGRTRFRYEMGYGLDARYAHLYIERSHPSALSP